MFDECDENIACYECASKVKKGSVGLFIGSGCIYVYTCNFGLRVTCRDEKKKNKEKPY